MHTLTKALFSLAATAAISLPFHASADPMEVTPLIIAADEVTHTFSVEIANDPDEISYGLMDRPSLDPESGMLFDFGQPRETAMYMKNTLIPLDMLFLSADGTIEMIARNTVPGSLRTISPGIPVKAVLEINGGKAAELGIEPGDKVVHPIFESSDDAAL